MERLFRRTLKQKYIELIKQFSEKINAIDTFHTKLTANQRSVTFEMIMELLQQNLTKSKVLLLKLKLLSLLKLKLLLL